MSLSKKLLCGGVPTFLLVFAISAFAEPEHFHNFKDAQFWTKKFDHPNRDQYQKPQEIVDLMKIEKGMTVADLGAGTGYMLKSLSQAAGQNGRIIALEVEPTLIEFMKNRVIKEKLKNVELILIDPVKPKLSANQSDKIVVLDTWHHLENHAEYFANLRPFLKPGGQVFIIDYDPENLGHGPPLKVRVPPREVKRILAAAGYEAEILSESLPYHYIVRGTAVK